MMRLAADWLLAYWLHGVTVCALALLVGRGVRRPATRVLLWRAALFAPIATATLALAGRATGSERAVDVTTPLRRLVGPAPGRRDVRVVVRQLGSGPIERTTLVDDPLGEALSRATCGLVLLASVIGGAAMTRRRRRARAALAQRTPIATYGSITLSTAPAIASPVALAGGEICVPTPDFFALSRDERRGVLLHEMAHVERGDPLWLDSARIVAAVAWWQPLHRRVLSALRRDTELAADDRAIARGARPTALVSALAHFAAGMEPGAGVALADASDGDSPLVARARRILGDVDRRPRPLATALVVTIAIPVLLALVVAPRPSTLGTPPRFGERPPPGAKVVMWMEQEQRIVGVR